MLRTPRIELQAHIGDQSAPDGLPASRSFFDAKYVMLRRRSLPSHGLKSGDVGAVVQVYSEDAVEVEFVTARAVLKRW